MSINMTNLKKNAILTLAAIGGIAIIKTAVSVVKKVKGKSDDTDEKPAMKRPLFDAAEKIVNGRKHTWSQGDMAMDCCRNRRAKSDIAEMRMDECEEMSCCDSAEC